MAATALEGVKVLDLAGGVGAAWCARLLAGLGADVLRIEPPGGDALRRDGANAPAVGAGPSPLFAHLHAGKRSLTLDITQSAGDRLLRRLVRDFAHVVVDSRTRAEAQAARLDLPSLSALRADVILSSVTCFGHSGPDADLAGSELVALARGGYLYLTGDPEREPLMPWGFAAEYHAAVHAATGTCAAVLAREAGDGGCHVDTAVVQAADFLGSAAPAWAHFFGHPISRAGNRLANQDPHMNYPSTTRPCADGWVHVHGSPRDRRMLAELMETPRLAEPDLVAAQFAHADEIDALMDAWLATRTRRDAVAQAQARRIPFGEVLEPAEVAVDPHLRERGAFADVDLPGGARLTLTGAPARMSGSPWPAARPPLPGEHTDAVLHGLGLADGDIEALRSSGIV
jgi:formyl-CoA transferase